MKSYISPTTATTTITDMYYLVQYYCEDVSDFNINTDDAFITQRLSKQRAKLTLWSLKLNLTLYSNVFRSQRNVISKGQSERTLGDYSTS